MKKAFQVTFEIKKMVGIWLALLMCGSIAMILVQLLPQERIKNNIRSSCELMQEEGVYPTLGVPQVAYSLDNWTDASVLEFIFHADNARPIYSAFVAEEVSIADDLDPNGVKKLASAIEDESLDVIRRPSYWNGFIVFLRPLLCLFDYYVARGILHKLAMILVGLFIIWNARRVGCHEAIGSAIIFSLFTVYVLSMNFAMGIFCLFIAMGAVVYLYESKDINYLTAMFVVGIITAYMDWLSIPLITFGVPMVYVINKMYSESTDFKFVSYFNTVWNAALGWCMGYGVMIISKTLISSLVIGSDAMRYLVGRLADDAITNSGNGGGIDLLMYAACAVALVRCIFPEILELDFLKGYIGGAVVLILIAIVIGIIFFYYKHCTHKQSYIKILLLIALSPLVWYIVFSGHINHTGIEFRTLMISCYAVWFIFKPRKHS